jgi:hypothetical protein
MQGNSGMFSRHHGSTLIELLISLVIASLLLSLTLSAVQSSREAARRMDCLNHVRQHSLAVQNFHTSFNVIPPNGGAAPGNDLSLLGGPAVQPATLEVSSIIPLLWGVGDPKRVGRLQTGPWTYSILPQLELGSLFDASRPVDSISIYDCSSRTGRIPTFTASDQYGDYVSGGLIMAKTDYAGNERLIMDLPHWKSFRDIEDGLSNTILIGEKAYDPFVQTSSSWYWDEPVWIGGSNGTVRHGLLILPDNARIPFRNNWGSAHIAGANFTMVDGSAKFISTSIDVLVLKALLTPAEHDTVKDNSGL